MEDVNKRVQNVIEHLKIYSDNAKVEEHTYFFVVEVVLDKFTASIDNFLARNNARVYSVWICQENKLRVLIEVKK